MKGYDYVTPVWGTAKDRTSFFFNFCKMKQKIKYVKNNYIKAAGGCFATDTNSL